MSDQPRDIELVERAQCGDKKAFDLLVVKYYNRLSRLLSRFVSNPEEVEDLAQETFIKAYRALPSFRNESAFYTWLYRIGVNTAKNHFAAMGRQITLLSADSIGHDDDERLFQESPLLKDMNTPEHILMSKEIMKTVAESVESLPDELKTAITLRELDGLSYEEIATVMNCPIGTVRSRIFRAREAVAERLKPLIDNSKSHRWG